MCLSINLFWSNMSRYLLGKKIDFRNSRTLCLQNIKTTRLWCEKLRVLSARITTESEMATTSCMMLYLDASRLLLPDASAAERLSRFTSLKSRNPMRLFRRIRYIKVRVRRFFNQLVEKILLYDYGITCSLPKDETYDKY